jgi:hypothetical protein
MFSRIKELIAYVKKCLIFSSKKYPHAVIVVRIDGTVLLGTRSDFKRFFGIYILKKDVTTDPDVMNIYGWIIPSPRREFWAIYPDSWSYTKIG